MTMKGSGDGLGGDGKVDMLLQPNGSNNGSKINDNGGFWGSCDAKVGTDHKFWK